MSITVNLKVEHNMLHLIERYDNEDWCSKDVDLKLQFIEFLFEYRPDEVEYGISYLKEKSKGLYELFMPIILEYRTFGLKHFKDEVESVEVQEEETTETWWDKFKNIFKKQDVTIMFRRK